MQTRAGLDRLQYMAGIESNVRNLEIEDNAIRRDIEMHQREEASWNESQPPNFDENDMGNRIMAARDVHFHPRSEPESPKPAPLPERQPPVATPPPPQATFAQKAAPWVAAAGMGLGGLGLGYGLSKPGQSVSPGTDISQSYEDKTIRYYQIDENGKRVPIAIPHISKAPQSVPE